MLPKWFFPITRLTRELEENGYTVDKVFDLQRNYHVMKGGKEVAFFSRLWPFGSPEVEYGTDQTVRQILYRYTNQTIPYVESAV